MSQVNPPYLLKKLRPREAITKSLKYKDESGNLVDAGPEFNNYLDQLERFAEQMYRRVGGSTDAVADTDIGFYQPIDIDSIISQISDFPPSPQPSVNYYTVSGSHTTSGDEFLRVTSAATITLNPNPDDRESVAIQPSGNFRVTILGAINGGTSLVMSHEYDLCNLVFISDIGDWVVS